MIKHSMDRQQIPRPVDPTAEQIRALKDNPILLAAYSKSLASDQIRYNLGRIIR